MTPQAILKARFSELAHALGVDLSVKRQVGKFYFVVTGPWENTNKFIESTFPRAWPTSSAVYESTYGLPIEEVERVLSEVRVDPDWLKHRDSAPLRIAQLGRRAIAGPDP